MRKPIVKHIFIAICIALLGFILSSQRLEEFPPILDTQDEVSAAFGGISLIQSGTPKAWSWLVEYGNFPIQKINGNDYRIVEPYFDDSPLFLLMSGAYALSQGMDSFDKVNVAILRAPMPYFFFLNVILLFTLIYLLRGVAEASVASLIFATVPTIILGSRLPLDSNLLVTTSLLSLVLFVIYRVKRGFIWLVVMSFVAGVSFLIKPTGVYISLGLILLSLALKDRKSSMTLIISLMLAIATWFLYGYYYNWHLFLKLLSAYNAIFLNFPTPIIDLFDVFRISNSLLSIDGWIIWGWACVILYSFLKSKGESQIDRLILPVMLGSYLVLFAIMSGFTYGWYRLPLYPFLAWASALVILEIIKNPKFLPVFFFITLPVSSSYIYGTGGWAWNGNSIKAYQMFFVALMAPVMFFELFHWVRLKKVVQVIIISTFILGILFNILTILYFQDYFWNRPQPWLRT